MSVRSIRRRVVGRVLVIQAVIGGLAILLVVATARFEGDAGVVASLIAMPEIQRALADDRAGRPHLACDGTVARRRQDDPDHWVYVRRGDAVTACHVPDAAIARSDALASGLASGRVVVREGPGHRAFALEKTDDGTTVAVAASRVTAGDKVRYVMALVLEHVLAVLLVPFVGLAVGLLAVSRDVRASLRSLSTAAAAIDQRQDGVRLDIGVAPAEAMGLVRSFNDLLDRMQTLSSRQRRFLFDVAHELRHALAIMRMRIDDMPPGELRARLASDLDRLGSRVVAMIALARLRQGLSAPEDVDLRQLAQDVVADRAPLAIEAGCDLRFEADPFPLTVRSDRALLDGILCNLVDNAVAHAGAGAVIVVHVAAPRTVTVSDTGRGMPADGPDPGHPFVRASAATGATGIAGLGLGLALVRESVAALGASFEIASRPGGGTMARVTLPSEGPSGRDATPAERVAPAASPHHR